eukprot:2806198-Amphidinium_carterae.4
MVDMFNQNGLVLPMAQPSVTKKHDQDFKTETMQAERAPVVLPMPSVESKVASDAQRPHHEVSAKPVNDAPEVTGNGESRPEPGGPDEFRVQFSTQGKKMGAEIAHGVGRNVGTVRIKSIRPGGLIHDWNMQNPDYQITEN